MYSTEQEGRGHKEDTEEIKEGKLHLLIGDGWREHEEAFPEVVTI